MSDTKFASGSAWRTRGGTRAEILTERTPYDNLRVLHDDYPHNWLAHSPSTGECLFGWPHRDLIAPWGATPSAKGIYVASKAKYGHEWVALRDSGLPIISTWIDESGDGCTSDWPGLWTRCVTEAASAQALVLICRDGDVLKGAWVEVGAALAAGRPIFAVGIEAFSIRHHPNVHICPDEASAFVAARDAIKQAEACND